MICIISGLNGHGKTSLMAHFGHEAIFDRERNRAMLREVALLNANGFRLTAPQHAVASSIACNFKKLGKTPRVPRIINPLRLGFQDGAPFKMHFTLPFETYLIDEAQMYFSSKNSKGLPAYQSAWFEEHRHSDLNIYMATPAPILIHKDIRRLASCINVESKDVRYDRYGDCRITWRCKYIDAGNIDKYLDAKPREIKKYYKNIKIVADYDIHTQYNSKGCKYKFLSGHLDEDFDLNYIMSTPRTKEEYRTYIETFQKEYEEINNDETT